MGEANVAPSLETEEPRAIDFASEESTEEESTSAKIIYGRFLGMGLLIAWLCCTHITFVFPGGQYSVEIRNIFDYAMRIGDIGMLLGLGILASRLGKISQYKRTGGVLVALTCLGTLVAGLVAMPQAAPVGLLLPLGITTALGGAVLFCLWAEIYVQMGITRVLVYGSLSCLLAGGMSFVVCTMQPPFAIIATSLLPAISLWCALASLKVLPTEPLRMQKVRYAVPWKLVAIMTVAGFLSGASGVMIAGSLGIGAMFRVLATAVAGGVILFVMFALRKRLDMRFLATVALPSAVIALALIPFAQGFLGYIVAFLLKFAYVWFTFFVLLVLTNICYRFEVPTLRIFAIARACSEAGILVGIILRRYLISSGFFDNPLLVATLSLTGIVLVIACVLVWVSEKSVNGDWGAAGVAIETNTRVANPREQLMDRCDVIAAEYGLTARETEIMNLIAQGKTRREIENELFLSENTVKTHARHLYAKLGTSSKADVIALLKA